MQTTNLKRILLQKHQLICFYFEAAKSGTASNMAYGLFIQTRKWAGNCPVGSASNDNVTVSPYYELQPSIVIR